MQKKVTIFWFRQDLRLGDNAGLLAASKNGPVIPIYIFGSESLDQFSSIGSAGKWWLHHSLTKLNKNLDHKLNIYIGDPKQTILELIKLNNNIGAVYWNRCYEPFRIKKDSELKEKLKSLNIDCQSFNSSLLWEPWEILKNDGSPYKVYTYFYRKGCLNAPPPRKPLSKPKNIELIKLKANPKNYVPDLSSLKLLPKINWYYNMAKAWNIGEDAAQQQLKEFLTKGLLGYKEGRNYPERSNVSKLSPYLHFGEISVHQVWDAAKRSMEENQDLDHFLSELGWREFSYYLLYHFPDLPEKNFQSKFDNFPWRSNVKFLKAWQTGNTGYPIIDAGMRELWQTGYIHNRVRMIVASFLVKNLLLHWHEGAKWFWDCLVDADLANNSASWQWVAGSGADAAPYFRIFNPITQGEKFDPDGNYTKKFVPELAKLPSKYLFKPWEAPIEILQQANIILGKNYPKPIVSLDLSRNKALAAYKDLTQNFNS